MAGFCFDAALWTWILGIMNGASLIVYNRSIISASQKGPYSVLMTFSVVGGILVPAVLALARNEHFTWLKWVSIALVVGSVYFVIRKKDEDMKAKKGFYLACTGLGISNGLYIALLDLQQAMTGNGEKEEMIMITYFISGMTLVILSLVTRRKKIISDVKQTKRSFAFLLLSTAVVVTAIYFLSFLIEMISDTTVLFTFMNAGVLLFSVLFSCLFLKEKLSLTNIVACVIMCLGLIGAQIRI
jgi:EamA domain-containing membrane protein RarD